MELKPGMKLRTSASGAEFIVIRAATRDVHPTCAGVPLSPEGDGPGGGGSPGGDVLLGKRYRDPAGEFELLCTHAGPGPVVLDSIELTVGATTPLPSSD